ncbi:MAG: MASE1 domain-containing protein, partial [Myxococcales bacterium]|nr:MASE1 domain-containing protein [Myxococcales bacterium]
MRFALLVIAEALLDSGGAELGTVGGSLHLDWVSTGTSLAALIAWGPRYWPAIALGATLAQLPSVPAPLALLLGVGHAAGTLLAASYFLREPISERPLRDWPEVLRYLRGAALAGGAQGLVGGLALALQDAPLEVSLLGGLGATGAALAGYVALTPALLSIGDLQRLDRSERLEASALVAALAILLSAAFLGEAGGALRHLWYLPLPVFIWSTLRFGLIGSSGFTTLITLAYAIGTAHDLGPFAGVEPASSMVLLWGLMITLGCSSLGFSIQREDRRRAQEA